MKKTVFILTVLLGTTVAFGQRVVRPEKKICNSPQMQHAVSDRNDFSKMTRTNKSSVFTKDAPVYSFDFSDTTKLEIGRIQGVHNIAPNYRGDWAWAKDTNKASFTLTGANTGAYTGEGFVTLQDRNVAYRFLTASISSNTPRPFEFTAPTAGTGFVFISPIDNYIGWGGVGATGTTYDAYIKLRDTINTTSLAGGVDVNFYQYLQVFNAEGFYIEWSTDNITWDTVRINLRSIDADVNEIISGPMTVSLPSGAAGQSELFLRFRYFSSEGPDNAGYVWCIDDLTVTQTPDYRLENPNQFFSMHAYHRVPAGLKMSNMLWFAYLRSTGKDEIYMRDNVMDTLKAHGTVEILGEVTGSGKTNDSIIKIGSGIYKILSMGSDDDASTPLAMPTTGATRYAVTSKAESPNVTVDPAIYTDTFFVDVNGQGEHYRRVWGRDNSLVRHGYGFNYGSQNNAWGDNDAYTKFRTYEVLLAYELDEGANTGDFANGIWANGIEIVAAPGKTTAGAKIDVALYYDEVSIDEDGNERIEGITEVVRMPEVEIKPGDITELQPYPTQPWNTLQPVTKYIQFTEPYELTPGRRYRVAYNPSANNTTFQLARGWRAANYSSFGTGWQGNMFVQTTESQAGYVYTEEIPMIRLVVGPEAELGINDVAKLPSFNLNNIPNPAKENTTIKYTLAGKGNVSIEVRDIMGRIVKSVSQGIQIPGDHTYVLSTSDLANGTYFYSLNVSGSVQTKKLVISK